MKMNKISLSISTALLAAGFMTSSAVIAQGRLVVYCSATNILCETTTKAFGEKYDVNTSDIPRTPLLTRGNPIFSTLSILCRAYPHTNNFFIIPS